MDDQFFSVQDKVCVITGASTGLGAHFSRLLLSRGAYVVGIAQTDYDWDVDEFAERFEGLSGDVCEQQTIEDLFARVGEKYGRLDVVVNNAGVSRVQKAMKFTPTDLKEILDVNFVAAAMVCAKSADLMRNKGADGSIINISSVMADSSVSGLSAYSATKAALAQLTRGVAVEWARHGIRVNNLAPGWFHTAMTDEYLEKGMGKILKTRVPMGRLGSLSDLDGALILLASDASKYMTGSTVSVDGGFSIIN